MEREILFRGKLEETSKWSYGYYTEFSECDQYHFIDNREGSFRVVEETVGEYTGLKDKNGVKIFEGDIVRVEDDEGNTNFVDGGIGTVLFLSGMWYIDLSVSNSLYDMSDCYYIEVIGNVYDNPELLT